MTINSGRVLYWAPRAMCILFIGFVSLFALDVFNEGLGFWRTILALFMHLVPSLAMLLLLAIAWRWEWVGAIAFTGFAVFFGRIVRAGWAGKAMFVLPCLLTAALFLVNWISRRNLRPAN